MKSTIARSLAAWVLLAGCAAAPKPGPRAPEQEKRYEAAEKAVDLYIAALAKGDLAACASLMHPKALDRLRDILIPIIEPAREAGNLDRFLQLFSGVETAEQLAALSREALFVAFIRGALFAQPGLLDAMRSIEQQILGAVAEGDQKIHVVYRIKMNANGTPVNEVETISLERDGESWRLQLSGDIRGSAERIRRLFAGPPPPAEAPPKATP